MTCYLTRCCSPMTCYLTRYCSPMTCYLTRCCSPMTCYLTPCCGERHSIWLTDSVLPRTTCICLNWLWVVWHKGLCVAWRNVQSDKHVSGLSIEKRKMWPLCLSRKSCNRTKMSMCGVEIMRIERYRENHRNSKYTDSSKWQRADRDKGKTKRIKRDR